MAASTTQTLTAIEAKIKQRGEERPHGKVELLAGHVPTADVPTGRRGGMILNLAASKSSGMNDKALHPAMCTRLGGVALFAVSSVSFIV